MGKACESGLQHKTVQNCLLGWMSKKKKKSHMLSSLKFYSSSAGEGVARPNVLHAESRSGLADSIQELLHARSPSDPASHPLPGGWLSYSRDTRTPDTTSAPFGDHSDSATVMDADRAWGWCRSPLKRPTRACPRHEECVRITQMNTDVDYKSISGSEPFSLVHKAGHDLSTKQPLLKKNHVANYCLVSN